MCREETAILDGWKFRPAMERFSRVGGAVGEAEVWRHPLRGDRVIPLDSGGAVS
jgi:hypothetical protein